MTMKGDYDRLQEKHLKQLTDWVNATPERKAQLLPFNDRATLQEYYDEYSYKFNIVGCMAHDLGCPLVNAFWKETKPYEAELADLMDD